MNNRKLLQSCFKIYYLLMLCVCFSILKVTAQSSDYLKNQSKSHHDTTAIKKSRGAFLHQLGIEYRPAWIIPSAPFYNVENKPDLSVGFAQSAHIKYAFAFPKGSLGHRIFPRTYQGIGVALFDLSNHKELGSPTAVYIFQKSEIATIFSHLSFDYEWNFGVSMGWHPYDSQTNPNNIIVGSKVNAYINLGAYLRWQIGQRLALIGGADFTHFSNGNTEYPNAGVNFPGIKAGLAYDISKVSPIKGYKNELYTPKFSQHLSYDMILFGSLRRKGVDFFDKQIASPYKYPVVGAYFSPMYNWGYRFRSGVSLDLIHDGSANVYTEDYIIGTEQEFFKPNWKKQIALGMSARLDYVMPLFTIGLGVGTHILHHGGDFNGTYQAFALKIRATKNSFVHIGYNLKDFHEPNYLMLGLGYRFNNKTPSLLR